MTTVASASYGAAGEMQSLSYFGVSETRTYNNAVPDDAADGDRVGTLMDMTYNYTAGANNGRIVSASDGVVGETVNYTYDALNRLTRAETAGSGGWGQAFTYDGFGNHDGEDGDEGDAWCRSSRRRSMRRRMEGRRVMRRRAGRVGRGESAGGRGPTGVHVWIRSGGEAGVRGSCGGVLVLGSGSM